MAKTAHANEPSMEEILASIRRIISDEEATSKPVTAEVSPLRRLSPEVAFDRQWEAEAAAAAAADLDEREAGRIDDGNAADAAATPEESAPVADEDESVVTLPVATAAPEPAPPARLDAQPATLAQPERPEPPRIVRAVTAEDAAIPSMVAAAPQPSPAPDPRLISPATDAVVSDAFSRLASTMLASQSRTLEDIVQDMMRPMLRNWLDENLPTMVERLVREEIERVSRGPRR